MDAPEAINVTTIQLTSYKGLHLPPRDYMSCQPLSEEWEPRIPNLHKYNHELDLLLAHAKSNNKIPPQTPLTYLPFHHQFAEDKESRENNQLKIFKLSKTGMKAMSELAKRTQRTRPLTAFKHSESSLVNLQPVYAKIFSGDESAQETTKIETSWKTRSKTYRFSDAENHSEIMEIGIDKIPEQKVDNKRRKFSYFK